jgi:hypothetical protein
LEQILEGRKKLSKEDGIFDTNRLKTGFQADMFDGIHPSAATGGFDLFQVNVVARHGVGS